MKEYIMLFLTHYTDKTTVNTKIDSEVSILNSRIDSEAEILDTKIESEASTLN